MGRCAANRIGPLEAVENLAEFFHCQAGLANLGTQRTPVQLSVKGHAEHRFRFWLPKDNVAPVPPQRSPSGLQENPNRLLSGDHRKLCQRASAPDAYTGASANRTRATLLRDGRRLFLAAIPARTSKHNARASEKFAVASSIVRPWVMQPGISRQLATYHPSSPGTMSAVNTAGEIARRFRGRVRFLIGNTRTAIGWLHVAGDLGRA